MATSKFKKQYLSVNILLILSGIALLIAGIAASDRNVVYYIGIADRMIFGVLFIFNGLWNYFTDYYSIANNNKVHADKNEPKWPWLLVAAVGVGMLITAFMGYGFNGVQKPM